MGGRRLRAHPRLVPARRRLARRPDRPPAGVQLRLRALHRSPRSLCGLSGDPTVLNFARGVQGAGARGDVRDRAGADRAGVRGPRARERDRHLGGDRRRRGRDRAADRRRCSPRASAGSGSSSSTCRSGSRRSCSPSQARQRQGAPTRSRSTGPGWSTFSAGALPAHLRAHPRQRRGLGQRRDRRLARRRRRCCWSPSSRSSARRENAMLDLVPVPQARRSPASRSSPSRSRRGCSRCSST